MELHALEIGVVATLVAILGGLIQIWTASKRRDKEMQKHAAEDAVWRTTVELTIKEIQKSIPTLESFLSALEGLRKESHAEHTALTKHIDDQVDRLDDKVERVAKEGRESRGEIYTLIEKIRTK